MQRAASRAFKILVLCVACVIRRNCKISWHHAVARYSRYRVLDLAIIRSWRIRMERWPEIDKFRAMILQNLESRAKEVAR
jgi:hypothetical protein